MQGAAARLPARQLYAVACTRRCSVLLRGRGGASPACLCAVWLDVLRDVCGTPRAVRVAHPRPALAAPARVHTARALPLPAGLSRAPHGRRALLAMQACLPTLSPPPLPQTRSVCGTLINFSADPKHQAELQQLGTPSHLLEVLERVMGNECAADLEVRAQGLELGLCQQGTGPRVVLALLGQ